MVTYKTKTLFTLLWFIPSLSHENSYAANILISYKPSRFPKIFVYSFKLGLEMLSLLQFFSGEMPLSKWLLPNQKNKFYGYHKWGWSRNYWNRNSNSSPNGSTVISWKSSKYKPRKISKTNKTDLQWAEFLISKAYIKDICLTFNYSSRSSLK